MAENQNDAAFRELVKRIDPNVRLVCSWPLAGGVSAEITALELELPGGQRTKLVVRRHGEIDRSHNQHIAREEFKLLEIAHAHGLAAPKPVYLDESGELFPTPLLVIAFVEGETVFEPHDVTDFLAQMAAQLAKIHQVN